ncbi:MAG: hypothetical protein P4L43_19915 [Syntrophobacteraceae bacterium]|nr:hypothetical protein [Syntrophobacteraceae bacterium]
MKAGIIITGTGPILILTSADSLDSPDFVRALRTKGIDEYIAFEIPEEAVRKRYGQHFVVTMADMKQIDILRIVDVDGQRIFRNFDLGGLSGPVLHDRPREERLAA